jgi:DNA-binding NtrC family response regulator
MEERQRVLVVDDDSAVLESVAALLSGDYDVLTASGGEAGLALLESEKVAVVISDFKMPGMDGLSFLVEVKKRFPRSARVLMTAYADMNLVVRAMNEGEIHRFASKPYKPYDFLRIVEDCCRISQAAGEVAETGDKKTIIIGLDSHVLTLRLRILLGNGYEVLSTANGLEIIEMVSTHPVAAVVLGMSLAGIAGPMVAEYLKKERNAPFPVVLLSDDLSCPKGYLDSIGADLWIDAKSKTADQQLRDFLLKNA